MEFMNITAACISALVICTTNNIVLVSRYRSRAWLCRGCANACPYVKMFTVQVKGGSTAGEENCGYGTRVTQNCKNSSSVSWFFLLCLLLASKTCFSDTVLDLTILDGFFFSELCNCFWNQCEICPAESL